MAGWIDELAEQHDATLLVLLALRLAALGRGFAELSGYRVEEHNHEEAHEKQNRQRQRDKRGAEERRRGTAGWWRVDGDRGSLVVEGHATAETDLAHRAGG